MGGTTSAIRTPDQRLRVFVSSTLQELAPERRAARDAIERLALTPVLFELGARPHPPRDLYRAYLRQSDIFVGLYWERYGWVAPEEQVSGLEDEYNLAPPGMPKLIYIKQTGGTREPRLTELLDRIKDDDRASFKYFADADELSSLLVNDLAVLLAERFDRASDVAEARGHQEALLQSGAIPAPVTALIGRKREVAAVRELLARRTVRLVTLVGPGGIGKTRLATDVAARMSGGFPDGVTFVPLSPVDRAALVPRAIADALGVRDVGGAPLPDVLAHVLQDQRRLLVLDNFEQVLDAAPTVSSLLRAAPGLKVLVTSRALLHLSGEQSFEVGPLELPAEGRSSSQSASAALFVERARAVRPDFELTPENTGAVERICLTLEGVPLALELAAARMRVLSPAQLLERLDSRLTLLVGGHQDLPPRQQALRATIDWSTGLLSAAENRLLDSLGVFTGRFSIEAAEHVAGSDVPDALTGLGALVDGSLVQQQERHGRTYFTMLATVREYALERLRAVERESQLRDRHAEFYAGVAAAAESALRGPTQSEWLSRVLDELDNIRAAIRHLLEQREWDRAADAILQLYVSWFAHGQFGEARRWVRQILDSGDELPDRTHAIALFMLHQADTQQRPGDATVPELQRAVELFRRAGDRFGEAFALWSLAFALANPAAPEPAKAKEAVMAALRLFREIGSVHDEVMALCILSRVHLFEQDPEAAIGPAAEARDLAQGIGDDIGASVALLFLGAAHQLLGNLEEGRRLLVAEVEASARLDSVEGVAYGLEGLMVGAALEGNLDEAGMLLGASEAMRERAGLQPPEGSIVSVPLLAELRNGPGAADFDRAYAAGRMLSQDDAVALATSPEHDKRPVADLGGR